MNAIISVGTSRKPDFFRRRLYNEVEALDQKLGFRIKPHFWECGLFNFTDCELIALNQRTADLYPRFRHYLANLIAETIIAEWERPMVLSLLNLKYPYFSSRDRESIVLKTKRLLDQADRVSVSPSTLSGRKGKILFEVLEHLNEHNQIVIDGLVKFRLKEYLKQLKDAMEIAVEEHMLEREYHEFIRLLQYFVEIQEPRVAQAHVMMHSGGTFRIFDANGNPVGNEYVEGFLLDVVDSSINYEDLLISALITIAPRQIIIHAAESSRLTGAIDTIEWVFGKKVDTCSGCQECRKLLLPP